MSACSTSISLVRCEDIASIRSGTLFCFVISALLKLTRGYSLSWIKSLADCRLFELRMDLWLISNIIVASTASTPAFQVSTSPQAHNALQPNLSVIHQAVVEARSTDAGIRCRYAIGSTAYRFDERERRRHVGRVGEDHRSGQSPKTSVFAKIYDLTDHVEEIQLSGRDL